MINWRPEGPDDIKVANLIWSYLTQKSGSLGLDAVDIFCLFNTWTYIIIFTTSRLMKDLQSSEITGYRIGRILGSGSFATVYLAEDVVILRLSIK